VKMARIRTIKPEFFRHEKLQDLALEHGAEVMLVFQGLWGHCDKLGRFEWRPRLLKLDILPFLHFDMADMLGILESAGFVRRYSVDGREYGVIDSFVEHQRIGGKEAQDPEKHPQPPIKAGEEAGKQRGSNGEAIGIAGREGNRKGIGREKEPIREREELERETENPAPKSALPKKFLDSPYRAESEAFAEWFARDMKPSTIRGTPSEVEQWALVWYHLRETDNRSDVKELSEVIAWARGDPFWSRNFLTPLKLRQRDKNGQMFIDRFKAEYHQQQARQQNGQQRGITPDKLQNIFDWIDRNPKIPA